MEQKRCYACMQMKSNQVCEHCGYDEKTPGARHHLPAGTVLQNQYLIGRVLGQGGFGITYLGWDQNLDMPVAIKEYFPTGYVQRDNTRSLEVVEYQQLSTQFQNGREHFLREAKSLARLSDVPEIVHIQNFFQANGTAYIVMEYLHGITLNQYVCQKGYRLTVAETLAIFKPLMQALARVHDAGLIHRDISPDNIMLLPNGRIKLLDFGAARDVSDADANKELPRSTQAIVKHGFAPIEQYQSRGSLGPWTDVYALCATLFYCIAGSAPTAAPDRMMYRQNMDWRNLAPELNDQQIEALNQGLSLLPRERTADIRTTYTKIYSNKLPNAKKESKEESNYPKTVPVSAPAASDGYPKTMPVNAPEASDSYPKTMPVKAPAASDGYPKTMPVNAPAASDGYPKTMPVNAPAASDGYPKTMPVKAPAASDGYPKTMPVNAPAASDSYPKTMPASASAATDGYPKTAPVSAASHYPTTAPVTKAAPSNGYPTTAPVTKAGPADGYPTTAPVTKAGPSGGYPTTAPVTKAGPSGGYPTTAPVTKAGPSDGYPTTAPVTQTGPSDVKTTAEAVTQIGSTGTVTDKKEKKQSPKRILILIAAIVAAAVLIFVFFNVHIWGKPTCTKGSDCILCGKKGTEPAIGHDWGEGTCTDPAVCKNCGKSNGKPTEHQWKEATCVSPKTCVVCNATEGEASGHTWIEATYTTPKTCSTCGETSGNVKGYIGTVGGTWDKFYSSGYSSLCYVLDRPIERCKSYTLNITITNVIGGTAQGKWEAFRRDAAGNWASLGFFELEGDSISLTYEFDEPTEVTAVTALVYGGRYCRWEWAFTVTDVMEYVD